MGLLAARLARLSFLFLFLFVACLFEAGAVGVGVGGTYRALRVGFLLLVGWFLLRLGVGVSVSVD